MKAITKFVAGGVAIAAVASAAPAAAQYYPGYGSNNPYGGNVVGQVLNQVLGGGYGYNGYNGYGMNSQTVVNVCANAIQQRLNGGYNPYGNAAYGGGRVLGITSVEQRGSSGGGLRVRGVASSGRYGYDQRPDLTWKCSVDYRGAIVGLDVNRGSYGNGSYGSYSPYGNYDYSQYGYRRY